MRKDNRQAGRSGGKVKTCKWKTIQEGLVTIKVPDQAIPSREMSVFYNPVMKINRDISILFLKCYPENELVIADPLAGSGIRELRFLKELDEKERTNQGKYEKINRKTNDIDKIKIMHLNDGNPLFAKHFRQEARENRISASKISVAKLTLSTKEASQFLLDYPGYDYIEIDPFGSPNPFLDASIKRLSRRGVLAVTATDTSALCGTHPLACERKYWAKPLHGVMMHEVGLRILVRKVQLIGAQYEKALVPVVAYYYQHYFRVFFLVEKGKKDVDQVVKQHDLFKGAGPMWVGKLNDTEFLKKLIKISEISGLNKDNTLKKLLELLYNESLIEQVGFYDLHDIVSQLKLPVMPKFEVVIKRIREVGHKVSRTHYTPTGIKTDISEEELKKILHECVTDL